MGSLARSCFEHALALAMPFDALRNFQCGSPVAVSSFLELQKSLVELLLKFFLLQALDVVFKLFEMLLLLALRFLLGLFDFAHKSIDFVGEHGKAQGDHMLADDAPVFCERAVAVRPFGMVHIDDGVVGLGRRSFDMALVDSVGNFFVRVDLSLFEIVIAPPC